MSYVFAIGSIVCLYYGIVTLNQHYKYQVIPPILSTISYALSLFVIMNL